MTKLSRLIPIIGAPRAAGMAEPANAVPYPPVSREGFYHAIPGRGFEECSQSLRHLLGLEDFDSELDAVLGAFDAPSRGELARAAESLREQRSIDCALTLRMPDDRFIQCIGQRRPGTIEGGDTITLWFSDVTERERRTRQLQAENERLKAELSSLNSMLNASPIPVWRRREDLSITFCNLAYNEIVEHTDDSPHAADSLEIDANTKALARTARDQQSHRSEKRHIIVGGARKLYQIHEIPLPDGRAQFGFALDISDQDRIQEELKRHIAAQGDLLESSVSAMAIFGPDMRLKFFNQAYTRLWKLDEAFLESEPTLGEILEGLREKRRLPEQANFPMFKQQQVRRFTDLIEPEEEFVYLPDGISLRVVIIPHALGGLLFVYEDVTDRLALERSYNTLIAVQRATLDNLHEGVAVFEENGRLKLSNPVFQKLWQLSPDFVQTEPHLMELLEKTRDLYRYESWESLSSEIVAKLHTRDISYKRLERTDGAVLDWCCVPLPDGATLMTYYDVTDSTLLERSLREKNEALQESDRLKTQFLANVSYELRSPLTSIIGFSEVLKQHYFGELTPKQQEYLDGIYDSSQHLMNLINDILDLACIEAGYLTLELTRFDIQSMISAVLSLIRERVKEMGLVLDVECPKKIGRMIGDETRIKQVLFHLLSNAISFTPRGGLIVLGVREADHDAVQFWVEDNGVGIPVEEQPEVFEKFHRASNAGPLKSGTGLGLSVVENFVSLHGGKVELHSTLEIGTKVICTMPRSGPEKTSLPSQ